MNEREETEDQVGGDSDSSIFQKRSSRRGFLKGALYAGTLLFVLPELSGCTPKPPIEPTTESEKKIHDSLEVFSQFKEEGIDQSVAFALTIDTLLSGGTTADVATAYLKLENRSLQPTQQAHLAGISVSNGFRDEGNDTEKIEETYQLYKNALDKPGINQNVDKAILLAGTAVSQEGDLDKVANFYNQAVNLTGETGAASLLVAGLIEGDIEKALAKKTQIQALPNVNDKNEDALTLAAVISGRDAEPIMQFRETLKEGLPKVSEEALDLFVIAGVLHDFNVGSILEMYNYVGQVFELDQESIACLVLATVARDPKISPLMQFSEESRQAVTRAVRNYTPYVGNYIFYSDSGTYVTSRAGGDSKGSASTRNSTPYEPVSSYRSGWTSPRELVNGPASSKVAFVSGKIGGTGAGEAVSGRASSAVSGKEGGFGLGKVASARSGSISSSGRGGISGGRGGVSAGG